MMRLNELARLALLALAVGIVHAACDEDASPPAAATAAPARPAQTDARALERARDRWTKIEKADLIASYEFLAPELKAQQPLQAYIQRMGNSVYEKMRVMEVVGQKGDEIFLRVGGLWTSVHPRAKMVKLEPGQTMTQDVEFFELWRWVGDDWHYARPLRPEELAEEYPDLLPNRQPPAPETATPPAQPPTPK